MIASRTESPSHHRGRLRAIKDGAVGVAVEGDADVGVLPGHGFAHHVGIDRAAAAVDVLAVGIDTDRDHVGAQFVEHIGSDLVSGPVGAIDYNPKTVEGAGALQAGLEERTR